MLDDTRSWKCSAVPIFMPSKGTSQHHRAHLGKPRTSKMDQFSGKIQKFILQIFAILDDTSVMNFGKKLQYYFPKRRRGGSKAVWNFSENSSVLDV